MNKNLLKIVALMLVLMLFSVSNLPASFASEPVNSLTVATTNNVITIADTVEPDFDINEVYKVRFLNMLNHNYVYGESFKFVEDMINDSMPALIQYRESEDSEFLHESYVSDYMFNMYGIDFIDYSEVNAEFEQVEGYVYILPRGFSVYEHEITAVIENEDGSFTVKSVVKVSSHDSGINIEECETLFVRNEFSPFGFSIIRSDIGLNTITV